MAALIQAKLTPAAGRLMTTGRRFGGADALQSGSSTPPPRIRRHLDRGRLARATRGKDPGTLGAIKNTMFGPAVAALTSQD